MLLSTFYRILFLFFAAYGPCLARDFRPTMTPLLVKSPYLNAWLQLPPPTSNVENFLPSGVSAWPRHWSRLPYVSDLGPLLSKFTIQYFIIATRSGWNITCGEYDIHLDGRHSRRISEYYSNRGFGSVYDTNVDSSESSCWTYWYERHIHESNRGTVLRFTIIFCGWLSHLSGLIAWKCGSPILSFHVYLPWAGISRQNAVWCSSISRYART